MKHYDIAIIGGGINGAGIAADAASRGLKVFLCEKGDFASATSSMSSKLIHGGLRYLENYDFGLVRKALRERDILLRKAPHIIWPMEFVIPYQEGNRPYWLIRLGLFLYDHLYRSHLLPLSYAIKLTQSRYGEPLNYHFRKGFVYSDCWVDDARLVILNVLSAQEHGADMHSYTSFEHAERGENQWKIRLRTHSGNEFSITSRVLINAAGPWVETIDQQLKGKCSKHIKLVKGSHIIFNKIYDGNHAYLLQNSDGRVVFVIPYEEKFTLIGTTEALYQHSLDQVVASSEEKKYLCDAVNQFFKFQINPSQIIHSYAGVRPLYADDATNVSENTRDYSFDLDNSSAVLLSVFGGKITTYRQLAAGAINQLKPYFPGLNNAATDRTLLPGAFENRDQIMAFEHQFAWCGVERLSRYQKLYGKLACIWLNDCRNLSDLGFDFGCGLSEREVEYLIEHEMAHTLDDVLWRRTKLGLSMSPEQQSVLQIAIENYFKLKNNSI